MIRAYKSLLYALTIFLSAFLLFEIQLIAGKRILPWFGGSSSVWATSLLFFTSLLFLGYVYVYYLTLKNSRAQVLAHSALLALAAGVMAALYFLKHSLFTATFTATPPYLGVLLTLLLSVGLPFFVLSTSAPLLQFWHGTSSQKEPYRLYALSNAGSFLSLLAYPFFVEPRFTLQSQEMLWTTGFILFLILTGFVLREQGRELSDLPREERVEAKTFSVWTLLAALPAFMLVATTTMITQVIAPVPLLWVLPLAIYLLTFVLAFSGFGKSIATPTLLIVFAVLTYSVLNVTDAYALTQLALHLFLLFFTGLFCHAALYARRPSIPALPRFYLASSLGGMLGTLGGSVIAPLLFSHYWEFPIAVALSILTVALLIPRTWFVRFPHSRAITLVIVSIVLLAGLAVTIRDTQGTIIHRSRNFYGAVRITEVADTKALYHGSILHGFQFTDPAKQFIPTTYFTGESGVGRAILSMRPRYPRGGMRVGVIGLGTGTLASFCTTGDSYTFYEIDPRIVYLAREKFSFLSVCKNLRIRIGDARLSLQREKEEGRRGGYDVFVVDAFSNDTIPIHLLTKEAVELYRAHLRDERSILAIHTSNRYLNLLPVLARIAREEGLTMITTASLPRHTAGGSPSSWVLLSREPNVLRSAYFADVKIDTPLQEAPLWTDEYSNVLSVVTTPW